MLAEALIDHITGTQYNGDNVEHDINKTIQYNTTQVDLTLFASKHFFLLTELILIQQH